MKFVQFTLSYTIQSQSIVIEHNDFSTLENEHLKLDFIIQEHPDNLQLYYNVELIPKTNLQLQKFEIVATIDYTKNNGIFCNGFQSWTNSRVFYSNEKMAPASKLVKGLAYSYGDYAFYSYSKKQGVLHSWTYTYIKKDKNGIFFFASLDEGNGYTVFTHHCNDNQVHIAKDIDGEMIANKYLLASFVAIDGKEIDVFERWNQLKNFKEIETKPAIGWTSWYNYYTKIDEDIILKNINNFISSSIPIDIFQIDDGWQKSVGDWLNIQPKFKNGMQYIANTIKQNNITAGLWLAPFACEKNSFIFREKKEWILKDNNNNLLKIGYNPAWSGWFYALDFYNEEVRTYLKKVFDVILNKWNFDLVKLDFLYGTASIPQHGKSRGRIMHEVMQFLRECVGTKKILGCGVPLSAAMQTTDYCRIGADIHLSWEFKLLKMLGARERPSTYNAIHNTIARRHLNKVGFINDPDVFILRKTNNQLNFDEQYCLLLANVLFGDLLFNSDDLSTYDEKTKFVYQSIFPLVQKNNIIVQQEKDFYQVNFNIKENYYLVLFNLSDDDKIYKLPNALFFDNLQRKYIKGNKNISIKKRSAMCLLKISSTPFAFLGSNGHIFSGTEIEQIFISNNVLEIEWNNKVINPIVVWYRIPKNYDVEISENSTIIEKKEDEDFIILTISPTEK